MKLIDILVRDLPNLGGWPFGVYSIGQSLDGDLYDSVDIARGYLFDGKPFNMASDWVDAVVNVEQYEAALAASKPEWDGEFPIPAGTEVEVHFDGDDSRVWTKFRVEYMAGDIVVLHDYRIDNVEAYKHKILSFRPIHSEEDKKRDASIQEMIELIEHLVGDRANPVHGKKAVAEKFYDAIAAGKIPHIRID
ncbi:TPA: hypothetical protein LTW74_001436 [Enterobacter hormaechei]|nr:hypothetical protein [Enterobacter hormaechei]